MKYNFDQITNRLHTNSRKWDVLDNELPMWVADMDYQVFPPIKEAIKKAADSSSYGYSFPTDKFFLAYQSWWERRHDIKIPTEWMVYVSGVVSALDSMIVRLTKDQDSVMLLAPSYSGFYSVVNNNNRHLVTSDLIYQNDDWFIDYQDVEDKIIKENVKAIIFCNPHNPTGKVWSKEDIEKLYLITKKHGVFFISDEIHCDIVEPGIKYVPALSVSEDIITCLAPSKVFNLAGLQSAVAVIKDAQTRVLLEEGFYHDDVGEPNFFVEPATIAAYSFGDEFVDELNAYLLINKNYVKDFLKSHLPHLKVVSGQGTYLLWIDISYYKISSPEFARELRKETGLYLADGLHYGEPGVNFIRMNVATSLTNVKDAMNRLVKFIKTKE